jgi:hypothetical protein
LRCSTVYTSIVSPAIAWQAGRHARHIGKLMRSSSARVNIDLGDSEYVFFKWIDMPAGAEKAPMKTVIDPNRPESKAKLK